MRRLIARFITEPILREIRTMSDQVHEDITALNTSLTDIASQVSSISTELQNLQAAKPVGSTITDADAATLHTLVTNAAALDASTKALVRPVVQPTGTTSASGASGTDTVTGSAS